MNTIVNAETLVSDILCIPDYTVPDAQTENLRHTDIELPNFLSELCAKSMGIQHMIFLNEISKS